MIAPEVIKLTLTVSKSPVVAERLVPAVRTQSPDRYKKEVTGGAGTTTVDKLIGVTGRNPNWKINQKRD